MAAHAHDTCGSGDSCCATGTCGTAVAAVEMTGFEGWYSFAFPAGEFEVCLRPGGVLWCPDYMEQATWAVSGAQGAQEMAIDFKRYGTYMLKVSGKGMLEGASTADANDWRKMKYARVLTPLELLLLGKGGEW